MTIDPLDAGNNGTTGASTLDALYKINELVADVNDIQATLAILASAITDLQQANQPQNTQAEISNMPEQPQDDPPYAVPQHWLDYVKTLRHALQQTTTRLEADARREVLDPPLEAQLGRDALEMKPPG